MTSRLRLLLPTLGLCAALLHTPVRAQSDASAAASILPVASVVVAGSAASAGASALANASAAVLEAGAVLTIRAIEASARGTVYVLERASDGARVSVEIASQAGGTLSLAVGQTVTVTAIGAGLVLSVAGAVIAFVPNQVGRALLHNQRLTQ